ncbi:bifunctional hydroxymethylpyrimidine kinase/phosphomethylpyrimidine kinase [Pelomonas aquatica]|jgi:hydroxymethylpyrimidine/phosphomethylpyrimidine kinase|uniref:Hydroxymethylpyrimidine/phosphomethylpyrimidine kinase n=1 Tax=Pelomonas aquatica TaxID=431058 RepID=A0A9X4LH27_9BURK|nr:bifunctional hydroxymethylpyrimidine kinase/phosphomethylpyrimidine kinase [Pelomonas aquatica]MCY4754180.1 bifunctional hydroxymethylpyrimidine kinase/phosphomethylpyrimidine kinase [Pelomonas aquatica]MDG0863851.1 hydroxymethylpyrimidine/phosphomethylpyrimidine kinase [Pelomonas aquatica]
MSPTSHPADPEVDPAQDEQESPPPACVLCFNASDASGAGGLAGDVATVAAMGAHCLPVVTAVVLRDTAEVFEHHSLDADVLAEQARHILEDVPITAWKVGFLGNAEGVSAVAEVLSDYPDVPLVTYLPSVAWIDEDEQQQYLDALRELVLPQTAVLVGNHKTLTDFLLPDWDSERSPSARELAVAAAQAGAQHVLVTGIQLPNQFVDNVLASPQGPIAGEKFERFETAFVGAGDTLSAALAALLSVGAELHSAVSEALSFLDQSLDAGFRPGMGNVIPDRFFWALPAADEEGAETAFDEPEPEQPPKAPRRMH